MTHETGTGTAAGPRMRANVTGARLPNLFARARNLSGFALHVPKQMSGAIWDGLVRSSAWYEQLLHGIEDEVHDMTGR